MRRARLVLTLAAAGMLVLGAAPGAAAVGNVPVGACGKIFQAQNRALQAGAVVGAAQLGEVRTHLECGTP